MENDQGRNVARLSDAINPVGIKQGALLVAGPPGDGPNWPEPLPYSPRRSTPTSDNIVDAIGDLVNTAAGFDSKRKFVHHFVVNRAPQIDRSGVA
jgi:hypothetical protein